MGNQQQYLFIALIHFTIVILNMKPFVSLLASTLLLSSQAAIVPLKFNFGNQKPSVFSIAQCAGHEDDPLQLVEGVMEEVICMPGTTTMNTKTEMREDLPSDLMIKLDLKKIDPFPMTVPCLDGVGSCDYDICQIITDMGLQFVTIFLRDSPVDVLCSREEWTCRVS